MDVLINGGHISQCMKIPNHHTVYFKYIQISRWHLTLGKIKLLSFLFYSPLPKQRKCGNKENILPWGRACVHACCSSSNPMDYSPPGSSLHGIFQARILEWMVIPSSRGSSPPRDWTHVSYFSCIGRRVHYHYHHQINPRAGLCFSNSSVHRTRSGKCSRRHLSTSSPTVRTMSPCFSQALSWPHGQDGAAERQRMYSTQQQAAKSVTLWKYII